MVMMTVTALAQNKSKSAAIMPTVLKRPVVAEVARGGKVDIPISVVASPGDQVRIEISSPSALGTVSIIRPISSAVPLLHYISKGDTKVTEDSFRFRIKASGYAWNSYSAKIFIKNPKGILKMEPEKIDFGHVPLGSVSTASLRIHHQFGADISGRLLVPAPYSISGGGVFSLAEGQSTNLTITFAPNEIQTCPAVVKLTPSSPEIQEISLLGDGCAPFGINTNTFTFSDRIKQCYVQVTNFTSNSLSLRWTDDTPLHFGLLQIGPHESTRVALSAPQLELPAGSREIFYPRLGNSFYSIPVTLTVNGPPGKMWVETIKPPLAFYSSEQTIPLKGIIHNDTTNECDAELVLIEHEDEPITRSSVTVSPSSQQPFEFALSTKRSGSCVPSVQLVESGKVIAKGDWRVSVQKQQLSSGSSVPAIPPIVGGHSSSDPLENPLSQLSRFASQDERERLAIWLPPFFKKELFSNKLVLNWRYEGSKKDVRFVIVEKRAHNSISDRTGENSGDVWKRVSGNPKIYRDGWILELPMPFPGTHTYRVLLPDFPGENLGAATTVGITWTMYAWPVFRFLLLSIFFVLAVKALRRRL
jgi:hypothetical protein